MEALLTLLVFGAVVLLLVLPIIAMVSAANTRKLARQNEEANQKLTQRLHTLETQIQEIQGHLKAPAAAPPVAAGVGASSAGPGPGAVRPYDSPARPTAVVAPPAPPLTAPPAEPPAGVGASSAGPGPNAVRPYDSAPRPGVTGPPYVTTPAAAQPPTPPPHFATLEKPTPKTQQAAKRALSMEEVLGTDWLNKLGMIILVIGVALFLAYEMRELGPAGKVLVGFLVSAALLGSGLFFERRERWRILARAAMGGGWALLYFTTYAMNHIAAARVLESEPLDFFFLIIVAAAMVAHTLRYDSRVITGLALLLAFSTINISRAGPTGLIASAILAVALVVIVRKRRWFDLEVLAILALFLNHYYWLRPIIEPMGEHHHAFPEMVPSTLLLFSYWLIFRFSYIYRRIDAPQEENISTVAAILNTFFFHYLVKYQSVHPELAFWFLLSVGTVELVLGQLPITKRRRTAFVILTTLGAILVVAAFPYRYSGGQLSLIWLAEAEAFFLAGVFTREILFRWLGIAAEVLVAGHMFFVDTHRLGDLRDLRAADFSDPRRALVFALGALVIFANAQWVPRRWPDLLKDGFEKKFYRLQSYLAGFLVLAAVWAVCTEPWQAVGYAACALALAVAGARWKIEEFSILANAFAVLGFLRVIFANFAVVEVSYVNVQAVITIALTAALLYLASRWIGFPDRIRTFRIPQSYTWVATFVVALLAWYQLWPASVALAWALLGLVLFQLGFERRSASLRLQGYALFMASFFRLFFVNFNAEQVPGQLSPRLYAALPLALVFYFVYARLAASVGPSSAGPGRTLFGPTTGAGLKAGATTPDGAHAGGSPTAASELAEGKAAASSRTPELRGLDARLRAADLHCYLGTITVAAAMRFELIPDWIAAAWAGLLFCFVLIAWRWGRRIFVGQALLLGAAVFFRTLFHNFYERSYFPPPSFWYRGWATVGTSIILLFLALLVARRLKLARPKDAAAAGGKLKRALAALHRNPAQVFFFIAFILLTGLLYLELHVHGMATVAWGVEAVAVFLFALAVKERSFRLSALALLLVCVAEIVVVDVWGLSPRDRYLTFIALGAALLSVSFLYTRYKEALRAYL